MTRKPLALAALALTPLTLTGCAAGWEGTAIVTEVELLNPGTEANTLVHDGVDITVLTARDAEASVTVADCPIGAIAVGEHVTVADVEDQCEKPVDHSRDD